MLDQLTAQARMVMDQAYREARRFHHDYVGTEHLLMALLRDQTHPIREALGQVQLNAEQVRASLDQSLVPGEGVHDGEVLPLTPRLKHVLAFAQEEASRQSLAYASAAHLFLGLIREELGEAALLLRSLGVDMARLRQAVLEATVDADPERQVQAGLPDVWPIAKVREVDPRDRLAEDVIPRSWDLHKEHAETEEQKRLKMGLLLARLREELWGFLILYVGAMMGSLQD